MGAIREFMQRHYLHFNSRELLSAAEAYTAHIEAGGKMFISLAGAMSTARIGRSLARMIRADKVHAISCTGANLEEDLFALLAGDEYEHLDDWRELSAADEQALYERGMNRVTDTAIPETVMRHLESRLLRVWRDAAMRGVRRTPSEHVFEVLSDPTLPAHFQSPPEDSWLLAAQEHSVPVWTPGWEDSTMGNMFTAQVMQGALADHQVVCTGTEQMQSLVRWYETACDARSDAPSVGFLQIGGGIAGDFAICAVPLMIQDLGRSETPFWGYFCQVSDAVTSYGGYSGAVPNEKITWGKLSPTTPRFMIQSDATIVAPLLFAYVMDD